MYYLKEHMMFIFSAVITIDSEQWFPATIFTDKRLDFQLNDSSLSDNQKQNYSPLSVSKVDRTHVLKWHFSQYHSRAQTPESTTQLLNTPYATFEHTIRRNLSDARPMRPKRKVQKICPSTRLKQRQQRNMDQQMKGKFLDVFEVVQFEHVTCTSSSGLEGTCLHEYECQSAGGTTMGTCADGYGTCCVIQFACDRSYSSPIGWFTNPGFPIPSEDRISCSITLNKSSTNIKQIRLDFLSFELLPPTSGTCEEDQFIISGQNTNNLVPKLCGINTGHHVYIEVGDVVGPILLSIQTVSAENRLYAIKVTQLSRHDELAAPTGCFQYYKEASGYLKSFNYQDNSDIGSVRYPGYLNNLNYAMCIERAASSCSITYTNSGEMQIPNYDTDGLPVIPPKQAGVEIFNCPSDWLLVSAIRLCGERLNDGSVLQDFSLDAPVTDNGAGPIVIWFRSDGGYVGRGFKLYYLQNTCTF